MKYTSDVSVSCEYIYEYDDTRHGDILVYFDNVTVPWRIIFPTPRFTLQPGSFLGKTSFYIHDDVYLYNKKK